MSVNKIILIGRLGKDPESIDKSSVPIAKFSLATSEKFKKNGQVIEQTEWHKITCFGQTAINVCNFLQKGSKVYLEGKVTYPEYTDKNGMKKTSTVIIASSIEFLDKKEDSPALSSKPTARPVEDNSSFGGTNFNQPPKKQNDFNEMEIPF